jgi:hypothetical protein
MLYITLLDQFHPGIYSSQVIDVCDYLNKKHNVKIRVLAFLSIKELTRTDAKKKLKELSPSAIVIPSFPGLKNFRLTSFFLFFVCLFTGERIAICRNVFCTTMALKIKRLGLLKKVVFDGRSAMAAEIEEYGVFPVPYLRKNIKDFERYSVNESDFRIAVSEQLVAYWKQKYNYDNKNHVVIPCTLDRKYFSETTFKLSSNTNQLKIELGYKPTDIVLVYSGSTAPWQSFELLEKMLSRILEENKRVKILFLSKNDNNNKRFKEKYNTRITIKWLEHKDVLAYLNCCDYGILVREQSDTNKVASPVKFAEYLYAGLRVLISENLGDFSEFVKQNNCGHVLNHNSGQWPQFEKMDEADKKHCFTLANNFFKKESPDNKQAYTKLINSLVNIN